MIEFRMATIDDTEVVHSITQDAWEEYRHHPGSSSALNETSEQIWSILATGEELVALGFLKREALLAVRLRLSDHLYFSRLGVRPAYQGRGFAKMALQWLEDFARQNGLHEIRCTVRSSVSRNVRLYESIGYRKVDEQVIAKIPDVQLVVWTMAKTV